MARDASDDEDEDSDDIHVSFKKLKIDPDWDNSVIHQQPQCIDIHSIWSGETSKSTDSKPSPKRPKHRVSPSRRTEPYPADCVLSFERLCLRKEKCNKKWCLCKYDKSTNASTSSDQKLNFVVGGPRKLIHEARLKLHHHVEKDHRQILRAAKLQINQAKRVKEGKEYNQKRKDKSVSKGSEPELVFGSVSKSDPKNFSSVEPTCSNNVMSDLPEKHFFDGYRGSEEGFNDSSKKKLKKNNYASTSSSSDSLSNKVEKSCSQEATIEDLSVDELAGYFDDFVHIPKKMSVMAEMMYT